MISDSSDEEVPYVPARNFTVDQRDHALEIASDIDPHRLHGDDPRHQFLSGDINAFEYHRAVMLLIESRMRTAHIARYTEENYRRWHRNNYAEPNSVYDAWLLTNEKAREQFDLHLFFQRFPGMKRKFPQMVVSDDDKEQEDSRTGEFENGCCEM